MNQYKHQNQSAKPHHKPNNRLERIATGSLLAFLLLLPTCTPAKAEFLDTLEGVSGTVRTHEINPDKMTASLANLSVSHASLTRLADEAVSGYDERLSKTISGQPFRYPLAFFVLDVCPASQTGQMNDTTHHAHSQGQTVYDGVTSQNIKANRRICGAVTNSTESEPRHPLNLSKLGIQSVALTQKLLGGNHA